MRVGIVVPTFHDDAARVLRLAGEAEAEGLDGVFLFDHLWHLGKRDRPALHGPTLMGAIAAITSRVMVGILVARIGIQRNEVLAGMLATIDRMAPGRAIAGLGIGDQLSREENEAYGIPFDPRPERLNQLIDCARTVRKGGVPVWIGGRTDAMWQIASAEADSVNLWNAPTEEIREAADHARPAEVTWAGLAPRGIDEVALADHLRTLAGAEAAWAIYAPVGGDDDLASRLAAARAGLAG